MLLGVSLLLARAFRRIFAWCSWFVMMMMMSFCIGVWVHAYTQTNRRTTSRAHKHTHTHTQGLWTRDMYLKDILSADNEVFPSHVQNSQRERERERERESVCVWERGLLGGLMLGLVTCLSYCWICRDFLSIQIVFGFFYSRSARLVFSRTGGFMLSPRCFSHESDNCFSSRWIEGFSKDGFRSLPHYVKDMSKIQHTNAFHMWERAHPIGRKACLVSGP